MRGKILGFDAAGGTGAISGADGKRYTFRVAEWRGDGAPLAGIYVDFDSPDGATATALFPEVKTVFAPAPRVAPPPPSAPIPQPAPYAAYPDTGQPPFAQPGPPPGYGQPGGAPIGLASPVGGGAFPGEPSIVEYMFMPLKRLLDFKGRSTRPEFWWWALFFVGVSIVGRIVDAVLGYGGPGGWEPVGLLISLVFLLPNLSVSWRRLHDTNKPGWIALIPYGSMLLMAIFFVLAFVAGEALLLLAVPFLGIIMLVSAVVLLVFVVMDGTPGPNRYGPDPKGRAGFSAGYGGPAGGYGQLPPQGPPGGYGR